MAKTPRPETEWIYDDLGRMQFKAVYDFTSARWFEPGDGFIGLVLAYTDGPSETQVGDKCLQFSLPVSLARALVTALQSNLAAQPE